MEELKP